MRTLLPLAGLAGEAIALGAKYSPLPPRVSLIRVQRTKHRDAQPYLVLLRRVAAVRAEIAKGKTSRAARNELETILVVDDDPIILKIVISILKRANFKILSVNCAETALKLDERKEDRINLLLSDVEMPGLSGPDLGEALKKSRPDVHVMFMSGGSTGNLLVLNYGWVYIQKPFMPIKLVEMIYEVMHSPNRSQLGGQEFDSRRDQR